MRAGKSRKRNLKPLCVGRASSHVAMSQDAPRVDPSVALGAKPAPFPGFLEPCHPTLRQEPPSGGSSVHEIKVRWVPHAGAPPKRRACPLHTAGLRLDAPHPIHRCGRSPAGEGPDSGRRGRRRRFARHPGFGLLHADLAGGRKDRLLYYRRPGHPSSARMTPPGPSGSHADSRCWQRQDRGRSATPPRACSGCRLALATRMDSSASLVASVMIRSADERV